MKKILLIDIGNTRLKWGLANGTELSAAEPLVYTEQKNLKQLEEQWASITIPDSIIATSVLENGINQQVQTLARHCWEKNIEWITSPPSGFGITNIYKESAGLGSDRWAAMVAAFHLTGDQAVCVISCGTAMTLDIVDAKGKHQGGMIIPGLSSMQDCLFQRTALSPRHQPHDYDFSVLLGKSTQECIELGSVHAMAGLIERVALWFSGNSDAKIKLIITGGDAEPLITALNINQIFPIQYEPHLVLKGMWRIAGADIK